MPLGNTSSSVWPSAMWRAWPVPCVKSFVSCVVAARKEERCSPSKSEKDRLSSVINAADYKKPGLLLSREIRAKRALTTKLLPDSYGFSKQFRTGHGYTLPFMESRFTPITETDRAILVALARYHYLTAAQASRLLYPRLTDENRYMQRRFKRLVDVDLVLRLRALPMPRYGQAPHVFTLAHKGRVAVQSQGVSVQPYLRPSEERQVAENNPIMRHRLAAVDVLLAADLLCRDFAVT